MKNYIESSNGKLVWQITSKYALYNSSLFANFPGGLWSRSKYQGNRKIMFLYLQNTYWPMKNDGYYMYRYMILWYENVTDFCWKERI